MQRFALLIALILWMFFPRPAAAQGASPTPGATSSAEGSSQPAATVAVKEGIIFPAADSAVQGIVSITARIPESGVLSVDLSFAYANNPASWFPLPMLAQPFTDDIIAVWDTTQLTDGFYNLRLRMFLTDGVLERTVTNVRIRNYSPLETSTPLPSSTPTETPTPTITPRATALPTATVTPTFTPIPSPTGMPSNPAALTTDDILLSLGEGILAVIAAFVLFGLLLNLSRKLRS